MAATIVSFQDSDERYVKAETRKSARRLKELAPEQLCESIKKRYLRADLQHQLTKVIEEGKCSINFISPLANACRELYALGVTDTPPAPDSDSPPKVKVLLKDLLKDLLTLENVFLAHPYNWTKTQLIRKIGIHHTSYERAKNGEPVSPNTRLRIHAFYRIHHGELGITAEEWAEIEKTLPKPAPVGSSAKQKAESTITAVPTSPVVPTEATATTSVTEPACLSGVMEQIVSFRSQLSSIDQELFDAKMYVALLEIKRDLANSK